MGERLTDKVVKGLPAPPRGNRIAYDSEVKGFGIRITAAGSRSFIFNYRRRSDGRERRATIGQFPAWSVTAARQRAAELRRAVDNGGDPVGELAAERGAPTVAALCARFEAEHLPKIRPSTRRMYHAMISNEILPAIGTMKVASVEYEHIDRLHSQISRRAPYMANRVLAALSKMFSLAILWKMRKDTPVRGVQRNQEDKRKRYLSADELIRLIKALNEHHNQDSANVFRLLLLTGARVSEVLSAEWGQFDLGAGLWIKPGATTKQKTEHRAPLNRPARKLLAQIRERGVSDFFVFPAPGGRTYRQRPRRDWTQICRAAGINGLRVHDLRHSFASQLASAGVNLHTIGALLGHSQPQTTHRYAHLFDDPLREATERAGVIITGEPTAENVPLKGARNAR
jgi:integrase